MDKQIVEQLNSLFKAVSVVEGFETPHREVLPAEIAAQLEAKDKEIASLKDGIAKAQADAKAEIEKTAAEKAELQKQVDAIGAEKAEAKRLADVLAKAGELLKDNAFADAVLEDVTEAAADKAFTADKVEAVVKARSAKYEKVAGGHLSKELPTGNQGRHLTDADITDADPLEDVQGEGREVDDEAAVKPAEELSFFAKKTK